jgi:large subunit ribosomal protein L29
MKAEKYRELTRPELERAARDLRTELFNLQFRISTQKLDNPLRLRLVRRDLARVLTILREDALGKTRLPGSETAGPGSEAEARIRQEPTEKEAVEDEGDRTEG